MTSPPPAHDVVYAAWGPVTVRVAWVLAQHGLAVKPEVLRDARDHVWFCLPADASVAVAEDRAERLVTAYVTRARRKAWSEPFPDDRDHPLPATWRDRLYRGLSRAAAIVLRLHLADGHPLTALAERTNEDLLTLEAALEGLREVVRRTAAKEGVDLEGWADDRLDHLLHRLSVLTAEGSPPLVEVVDGLHPEQADRCLTAARARVLVRKGQLRREDLLPPRVGALASDRVRVLALHVHPDGRRALPSLLQHLGGRAFPLADDLVLVDAAEPDLRRAQLAEATSQREPRKDHLRGVVASAAGRWTRHGLIGPLVDELPGRVRGLPWGAVEGLGELPDAVPAPPADRRAWTGVSVLGAVCGLVLVLTLGHAPSRAVHPLDVTFAPSADGLWVDLDVDDEAHLVVVADKGHGLTVVLQGDAPAEKAKAATGDGGFRLRTPGRAVLVASSPAPIAGLEALVKGVGTDSGALERLAATLREGAEGLDVAVAKR